MKTEYDYVFEKLPKKEIGTLISNVVVNCKNCVHRNDEINCPFKVFGGNKDDDYCSKGQMKL